VVNLALYLMIEATEMDQRNALHAELTGPFRYIEGGLPVQDAEAPSWWHGDEAAYEETMAGLARLPARPRRS